MIYQGLNKYPVNEIILHCSGCNTGQFRNSTPFEVFAFYDRLHKEERGWKGFGYHGLFMPDGTFFRGRPDHMIGAHVIDHNRGTLGWLLIESKKIDIIGSFSDFFTSAQLSAVEKRLGHYRLEHGVRRVSGHNQFAPKVCPGFHAPAYFGREKAA